MQGLYSTAGLDAVYHGYGFLRKYETIQN